MSLVHCCHHSHVSPGATSSPQLRRHFSIFSFLTFKPAPRIVLISKRQPQLQPPALCSQPEAHRCSAQSSGRHLRELAGGTWFRLPQQLYHPRTATCYMKTLVASLTRRLMAKCTCASEEEAVLSGQKGKLQWSSGNFLNPHEQE